MFGISWAELFVIILVGVLVIPVRLWPDVARFLARVVNAVRRVMWKISDVSEEVKHQIELEKPIDDLIHKTADEVLDSFSEALPVNKKPKNKSVRKKAVK